MRYLGLDVGDRRIGVAVADDGFAVARPLQTIRRRSVASDLHAVGDVAKKEGASRLVIGLPLTLAGDEGHQALRVRRFAEAASALGLPIDLYDERHTSVEAARLGAKDVDAGAAALLLEDFLRSRARP